MAEISYVDATCRYPEHPEPAVDSLSLEVKDGEFVVLVGPSGSGKTTALRMLAGLADVADGEIRIAGRDVTRKPPKDRDIAMVFQNYALYPHLTVAENMAFGLRVRGVSKAVRMAKVQEVAELLELEPYLGRKPRALSGGQRQRVAMGRAIVREPSAFLMDEPLSNLDAKLRVETRANIASLQARLGTTTIYVTHDQVEAMTMGHRVALLRDGCLQQIGTPRELYEHPANAFVAGFIGSPGMNLRIAPVVNGGVKLGGSVVAISQTILDAASKLNLSDVMVGLRPESFELVTNGGDGLTLTVDLVEQLGADAYVYGALAGEEPHQPRFGVRFDGRVPPSIGDVVRVRPLPGEEHAFHPLSGERL
jgi:multiple sugar transport system ATP-binding protein